jgi:hypothetical protein
MKLALSLHAIVLPVLLSFTGTGSAATYYTINPAEEAIISFHFDSPPITGGRSPNLLEFLIGGGAGISVTSSTYSLYDGNSLLGGKTQASWFGYGQGFRSFDNPITDYLFGPDIPVDFSSIRAGTIQGKLVYTPSFSNPPPGDHQNVEFELYLINQTSTSGGWVEPNPIVDSIEIVSIPEPSTVALTFTGALMLVLPFNRRWKNGREVRGRASILPKSSNIEVWPVS